MPERTKNKMLQLFSVCQICLLFALSSMAMAAEVYKWVDENGNIHYTDKKPGSDETAEKVDVKVHNTHKDAELDAYREYIKRSREASTTESAINAKKKAKQRQTQQKRKHGCKELRQRKREYQQEGVIYTEQKNGERKYVSDEEREDILHKLDKALNKYC